MEKDKHLSEKRRKPALSQGLFMEIKNMRKLKNPTIKKNN